MLADSRAPKQRPTNRRPSSLHVRVPMNSVTASWLSENVQIYHQSQRVYADIDAALRHVPTLRLKSEIYIHDDGRTQLLICLHGLLPISFRNATYNIPISLWIPLEYPRDPPITYVVPTSDMLVRPGKYLDPSGKSSALYLEHWSRKPEACSLTGLVEALQQQFSAEPPVYAKPRSPPVVQQQQQSLAHHVAQQSLDRPSLPSRPPPHHQQPTYSASTSTSPIPYTHPPAIYTRPQDTTPPYHVPQPTYASPPPPQQQWAPSPGPPQTVIRSPLQQPHQAHPVYHQPAPASINTQPRTNPPDLLDGDLPTPSPQPPPLPISLPPRPPNPELLNLHSQIHAKLSSEMATLSDAMRADAERLRAQQSSLLAGEPAIRDEMARLEAVRDVCRTAASRMAGTVQQGERNVTELRRKGDPEVDELICSTSIVHNQLINLVAEDNAIEDTIYHLHRALNTGRIELERFLRTTRVLAEEQFMKRALVEKIQSGLGPSAMSGGLNASPWA